MPGEPGHPETVSRPVESDPAAYAPASAPKIGMWLFLFTEVFLFGTLFIVYAVYSSEYAHEFRAGSAMLDRPLGAANTVILLTSSLTMALAISFLKESRRRASLALLAATVLLASAFLGIKAVEWSAKLHHGIYPDSPVLARWPQGQAIFTGLYFVMTGLHAVHVLIGAVVILVVVGLVRAGRIHSGRMAAFENTGLYWHLVDLVWIYLFPLFYLVR